MKIMLRMRFSPYEIIRDAVDGAVVAGYRRAHKHTEAPGEEAIVDTIRREVMNALCDVIDLTDGDTDERDTNPTTFR